VLVLALYVDIHAGLTFEFGEQEAGDWLADLVVQSANHNWKRERHCEVVEIAICFLNCFESFDEIVEMNLRCRLIHIYLEPRIPAYCMRLTDGDEGTNYVVLGLASIGIFVWHPPRMAKWGFSNET
jgi:hypothetical protein